LVAACAAVAAPVHQGLAWARDPTGVVPGILGVMVCEPGRNVRGGLPAHGGRGDVWEADAPLLLGETGERGTGLRGLTSDGARATGGAGPRRGRMLENRENGRHPRRLPHQRPKALAAWQQQSVAIAHGHALAGGALR
jgi:hypothetical protein